MTQKQASDRKSISMYRGDWALVDEVAKKNKVNRSAAMRSIVSLVPIVRRLDELLKACAGRAISADEVVGELYSLRLTELL